MKFDAAHPLRRARRGFTLLEMLIVVAIITFLLGILITVAFGLIGKSKAAATWAAVEVVDTGMERFFENYQTRTVNGVPKYGYPTKGELPDGVITFTGMTDGEFLRVLLFPTDDELEYLQTFGIRGRSLEQNEVKQFLNKEDIEFEGRTIPAGTCFIDAWNQPLFYRAPGKDHSEELNAKEQKGLNHREMNGKPDIWSIGEDGENWYEDGNEPQWKDKKNEPTAPASDETSDEICNWFPADRQ